VKLKLWWEKLFKSLLHFFFLSPLWHSYFFRSSRRGFFFHLDDKKDSLKKISCSSIRVIFFSSWELVSWSPLQENYFSTNSSCFILAFRHDTRASLKLRGVFTRHWRQNKILKQFPFFPLWYSFEKKISFRIFSFKEFSDQTKFNHLWYENDFNVYKRSNLVSAFIKGEEKRSYQSKVFLTVWVKDSLRPPKRAFKKNLCRMPKLL